MDSVKQFILVSLVLAIPCSLTNAEERVDFNEQIRPLLNQHCVACHGGVKQAADLSFVYQDQALMVIEPGDPDASLLIDRIKATDDNRMPPEEHGRGLNEQEIQLLERWVDSGAEWGTHWAFIEPRIQTPPSLDDDDWSRSRVDRFVFGRLSASGLTPAGDAAPDRWYRRVSLDLRGLPPTIQERAVFLSQVDQLGEVAYQQAVDQLLGSPDFGEHLASIWLDAVRYADSRGLGQDGRRTIWKFRDWVIAAFNDDMPYDQFTIRQLAGDLIDNPSLDDLIATSCNRLTQTNEEGGTDDEMFRTEAVIDRVNTVWQAWQGLSFGCVQCHSHPYDPIRHDEYYRFLAFFNNTVDSDLSSDEPAVSVPVDRSQHAQARQLDEQIDQLRSEQWSEANGLLQRESNWMSVSGMQASTNNSTRVTVEIVDGIEEYQTRGTVSKETTVTLQADLPSSIDDITALKFTGLPADEAKARIHSEWGFVISNIKAELVAGDGSTTELDLVSVIADEPDPIIDPMLSLNAKSRMGFGAYSRIHYPRSAAFVLAHPVSVKPGDRIRVSVAMNVFELGAFPLVAHRGRIAVSGDESFTQWWNDPDRTAAASQLEQWQQRRREIDSVRIPVMEERVPRLARPTFVFDRGNFLTKTEEVSARTPAFLSTAPSTLIRGGEETSDLNDRLDLARWIASTDNPLTARVMVNRIWAKLFGIGVVETQEDFGASGSPPSHPQLLDDLATRFQTEMNWSVKSLLKELVLSSTYRQSSLVTPAKLEADPRNRLLSRGPGQRLSAEVIRDQSLAIAGLLSRKMYGPPVHPPIPEGVWKPFQAGDRWNTPAKDDPDRYRKTVYAYVKRSIPLPALAAFDAPSREFCSMRRLPSNTPLQALMTLNDITFVEAIAGLAERMAESSDDVTEQIHYGFMLCTSRPPATAELDELIKLYQQQSTRGNDLAMKSVASVLLNLDEVLSK